jgi:hypothetical protein
MRLISPGRAANPCYTAPRWDLDMADGSLARDAAIIATGPAIRYPLQFKCQDRRVARRVVPRLIYPFEFAGNGKSLPLFVGLSRRVRAPLVSAER